MAGWRVGMLLGASSFLKEVLKVKTQMDSGMFYGIQKGAVEALKSSEMWFESLNSIYRKRRQLVWKLAEALEVAERKKAWMYKHKNFDVNRALKIFDAIKHLPRTN